MVDTGRMVTTASSSIDHGVGITNLHVSSPSRVSPLRHLQSVPQPEVAADPPARPVTVACDAIDAPLIAILDAPLRFRETAHEGFRRKEHELASAFAALTVLEARALHARLASRHPDDALALRFGRLVIDRRTRLLEFLADARRRQAISAGRR